VEVDDSFPFITPSKKLIVASRHHKQDRTKQPQVKVVLTGQLERETFDDKDSSIFIPFEPICVFKIWLANIVKPFHIVASASRPDNKSKTLGELIINQVAYLTLHYNLL
jgi:hypothetical protein